MLQADTAAVTRQALAEGLSGPAIGQRVHAARAAALAQALTLDPGATVASSTDTGLPVR